MDSTIDRIARTAAQGMDRRRAVAGLGALALGALGLVATHEATSAQLDAANNLNQCRDRCQTHCPKKAKPNRCVRKCKDKCRKRHNG